MLVKDVLVKANEVIPFPWTNKKIKKAGYDTLRLTINLSADLARCEDIKMPVGQGQIDLVEALKLTG